MTRKQENYPPRLALLFFRWFCHPDLHEEIEGDLVERFHQRSKHYGSLRNQILFIHDVLSLFRPQIIGKVYRFTAFPYSLVKLIYNNLRITAVVIAPLWIVSFIVLTFMNSKGCKQFVIDSSEIRMGIDIPKADFCTCLYDKRKNTRLAMYTLKADINDYIKKNDFKQVDKKDVQFGISFPGKGEPASKKLYARSGITWGDHWQYVIEKETGRIWVEIMFRPTPLTNIIKIIAMLIFYLPQVLVTLWLFKFFRMTYQNMKKLKITWL